MIKIGVIGYGYWGPNLVRNFAEAQRGDRGRRRRSRSRRSSRLVQQALSRR